MLLLFLQPSYLVVYCDLKNDLLVDGICVIVYLQLRFSEASAALDFSNSFSCFAPSSKIAFPVICDENEGSLSIIFILYVLSLCHYHSNQVQWVLCSFSTHHLTMQLPFHQCRSLWLFGCCLCLDIISVVSCLFTTKIESSESCVGLQCITQWCCSRIPNLVDYWFLVIGKGWFVYGCNLCSRLRLSSKSVLFVFNSRHNNAASASPILFSVCTNNHKKREKVIT